MTRALNRTTADLSSCPDLVVIYLGMRVNEPRGLRTLISFGPKIRRSVEAQPDGLLLHENLLFSLFPPHAGMRQYWRDFDCLERWARSLPHRQWWQQFLRDRGGTSFWHETCFRGGQIESVYIDMPGTGLAGFAPVTPARGSLFSARRRLGMREGGEPAAGHLRRRAVSAVKAMAGRIGLGSAAHVPTSPTAIDQRRPHPMPDPDHHMSGGRGQAGQQSRRAGALPLTGYVQFAQTCQNLNSGGDFDRAFLANGAPRS